MELKLFKQVIKLSVYNVKEIATESLLISMILGVIIMPLFSFLFRLILRLNRISAIYLENIFLVITHHPFFLPMLLILLIAFTILVYINMIYLILFFNNIISHQKLTRKEIFIKSFKRIRQTNHLELFVVFLYLILISPVTQFFFQSKLTNKINIPSFITSELMKNPYFSIIFIFLHFLLFLIAYKLIFMIPAMAIKKISFSEAIKYSFKKTNSIKFFFKTIIYLITLIILTSLYLFINIVICLFLIHLLEYYFPDQIMLISAFLILCIQISIFISTALATSFTFFYVIININNIDFSKEIIIKNRVPKRNRRFIEKSIIYAFIILIISFLFFINVLYLSQEIEIKSVSISHRGDITRAVENSIEALEFANLAGADYVEMDIMETKDEHFILTHDKNLRRLTSTNINVYDKNLEDLIGLPIKSKNFISKVSSFDDYLDHADELEQKLLIEIKIHGYESKNMVENFVSNYSKRILEKNHIIHTLDNQVIDKLKELNSELRVGYIIPLTLGKLPETEADFFVVEETFVSESLIEYVELLNKEVFVWTINDNRKMFLLTLKGVHGIITDDIDLLVEVIEDEKNETYFERAQKVLLLDLGE